MFQWALLKTSKMEIYKDFIFLNLKRIVSVLCTTVVLLYLELQYSTCDWLVTLWSHKESSKRQRWNEDSFLTAYQPV